MSKTMKDTTMNQIIKQEVQLLDKVDSLDVLGELIDDEFIEVGSSAEVYDKVEVMRWLASEDTSERVGTAFKAYPFADNIILLTYMSTIKNTPVAENKQAMRSSIWRLTDGRWRMVFHQGTPLK